MCCLNKHIDNKEENMRFTCTLGGLDWLQEQWKGQLLPVALRKHLNAAHQIGLFHNRSPL